MQKIQEDVKKAPTSNPTAIVTFHPNTCFICYVNRRTAPLRRCSGCKMISYCGEDHQKQHWPTHKKLCNVISTILKRMGCSHVFEEFCDADIMTWIEARASLAMKVESKMNRALQSHEREMLFHPRSCNVCHDCRHENLTDCEGCSDASFCVKHKTSHTHNKHCKSLQTFLNINIDLNLYGIASVTNEVESLIERIPMKHTTMPKSTKDFLDCFLGQYEISYLVKVQASKCFSRSLTLFGALQKLNFKDSELVVHAFGLAAIPERPIFWEILLHLLPNLAVLKVVIMQKQAEKIEAPKICKACRSMNKTLQVVPALEFARSKLDALQEPQIAVFHDVNPFIEEMMWLIASQGWKSSSFPFVITTPLEVGMHKINKIVNCNSKKRPNLIFQGLNSFSSLRPIRDEIVGEIYFDDRYLIICEIEQETGTEIEKTENGKKKNCGKTAPFVNNKLLASTKCPPPLNNSFAAKPELKFNQSHFYVNACQVCKSRSQPLVSCKRCKMIFYCNEAHQKEHWSEHKDLCKVVLLMMRETGISNLFENVPAGDEHAWLRKKIQLMSTAQLRLERKLLPYEQQMFQFPKVCLVCRESNPGAVKSCKCSISFCKRHKQHSKHKDLCNQVFISLAVDLNERDMKSTPQVAEVMENMMRLFCKRVPLQEKLKTLPGSIREFINSYKLYDDDSKLINIPSVPEFRKIIAADYFTNPLTLLYAMEKMSWHPSPRTVIHVMRDCMKHLETSRFWELILHWLPGLMHLKIVFVGPGRRVEPDMTFKLCTCCTEKGQTFEVDSCESNYEDFLQSNLWSKPDLVVGLNLDMYQFELGLMSYNWKRAINTLSNLKVPFICTAGSKERAHKEHKFICAALGKPANYIFFEQNPFASTRPYRDVETEGVFYPNDHLIVYTELKGMRKDDSKTLQKSCPVKKVLPEVSTVPKLKETESCFEKVETENISDVKDELFKFYQPLRSENELLKENLLLEKENSSLLKDEIIELKKRNKNLHQENCFLKDIHDQVKETISFVTCDWKE